MSVHEAPSVSVSRRGPRCLGSEPLRTVVWVHGEQDISNRTHLSAALAEAARLDDAGIVVDLEGVTFMDASTIAALVVARNRLGAPCRSLALRAPSPRARRLLTVCGLDRLIDESARPAPSPAGLALGSWVDVPVGDRQPEPAPVADQELSPPVPIRALVGRRTEPAAVQQRRALS